jgi:uncharacterized protein involved in exopolysaccharide biosynthesis
MAQQAVWQLKRVTLRIPVPSVAALRGRSWMVGPALLLGLLGALLATQLQATAWRGEAEVFFNTTNLAIPLIATSYPPGGADQYLEAQARLARSPKLAARVVRIAELPGLTAAQFLQHSGARPVWDADVLTLSVTYRPSAAAVRLTNTYAAEFVRFKNNRDLRAIRAALRVTEARIAELRARGQSDTPAYEALVQTQQQLTALAIQFARTTSVREPADRASSFRPHALRNGLVGDALGAVLGVVLVLGVAALRRARRLPQSRR